MKRSVAAVAAAALLTLPACGGGSDSDDPSDKISQGAGGGAGAGKSVDLPAPMAVPEDAADGGTFTILTNQVPATLDPTRAYFVDSTAIMSMVTRALTQYVYDPETQDMVLAPDMATDLGRPNEDNTEWTFTLKDGLKYEDGTEVTAEDVAYAIKRSFAIEELPDGPTYNTTFFLDGDTYKGPYKDGTDYAGVVVNGKDITIKMRRPFAEMDYYASFPQFTGIPEAKDTGAEYGNRPLATGPYKFGEYKAGTSLTLVKNEEWDPNTDPGRIQTVDEWVFNFGEDTAQLEGVIVNDQGEAQTTLTYDNVTPPTFRKMQSDQDRLVIGTSPCTYMWYIDMTKITDKKVREALNWAFPYQAYWKSIGEVVGLTRVAGTSILPPGTAGRVEYELVAGQDGETTDPEKSKALLKEAGAENYEIKFLYSRDDALAVAGKDEIVKGLEAGGFKATPIATTQEKARDARTDPNSPINVRSSGWCSDWPTGGSWFPAQWAGDLVGVEGMPNPANFKEADADAEQNRILDEVPAEEAAAAWGELDKMIGTEYLPLVNLGYSGTAMMHGSKVGGMHADLVRGMPTFSNMYIIE